MDLFNMTNVKQKKCLSIKPEFKQKQMQNFSSLSSKLCLIGQKHCDMVYICHCTVDHSTVENLTININENLPILLSASVMLFLQHIKLRY